MLLRLASIKSWHLAQLHVNFDNVVKHIPARVSLENCVNSFKGKDNEKFIKAIGRKRSLRYQNICRMTPSNDEFTC